MPSKLSITEEKLKVGQVRRVTSNNGKNIDYISLLLNDNVEVLFSPSENGELDFTISNPSIDMSNLDCSITKESLYDFVVAIKDAYNQVLKNESEVSK